LRVVCASHQSLRTMIARGEFRQDLYYRLNGLTLELPPLAERADKQQLIRKILVAESEDERPLSIETDAFDCLCRYAWPGNIRELRNVIRTALAISDGGVVRLIDLPSEVRCGSAARGARKKPAPEMLQAVGEPALKPIALAERRALLEAIRASEGNMVRAAQALRISRSSLYRRCRQLQVPIR
jgi:transcriptional regulator of acetoin/glycerol metabolism